MRKELISQILFKWRSKVITKKLINALQNHDDEAIRKILANQQKYIRKYYRDKSTGNTLLHIAFYSGAKSYVYDYLLSLGCPIDWQNLEGNAITDLLSKEWVHNQLTKYRQKALEKQHEQKLEEIYTWDYWSKDAKRIVPGMKIARSLGLSYGSKKPEKQCDIPDSWEELNRSDGQQLTLHQRLAMACAFNINNANSMNEFYEYGSSHNYVTANLGFVVSTQMRDGTHRRKFITIPINHAKFRTYCEPALNSQSEHSESILYRYLAQPENLDAIIQSLSQDYGITPGYKIYAAILDMHSTHDMCKGCQSLTYKVQAKVDQGNLLQQLENKLEQRGYLLPKAKIFIPDILTPQSRKLHFITRVSSFKAQWWNYPFPVDSQCYKYNDIYDDNFDRDIKKSHNSVIIHQDHNAKQAGREFCRKEKYAELLKGPSGFFNVINQTAFESYNPGHPSPSTEKTHHYLIKKIS